MISTETRSIVERAKRIYDEQLRTEFEAHHSGRFVAIEPDSGDHFLADTLDEAVRLARNKYPTRLSHIVRVGYSAAVDLT